jgi:hypothetical protein
MSRPINKADLASTQQLVPAPTLPNLRQDIESRHFDLPAALHTGYFGLLLAYLAVMFLGFRAPGMIIPIAICVIFTVGFYVVPALWSGMRPERKSQPASIASLLGKGVQTHVGWLSGRDAVVQVLTIPVLILCWGLAVVTIAAIV